jgi:CMP-N-acetylneuraminic acid synthetase
MIFIPARGGSVSIPSKNLSLVNDKPLLEWVITAAKRSGLPYVVSTDDAKIARIARNHGASVAIRSKDYDSRTWTIARVVWDYLDSLGHVPPYLPPFVILMQPTSPFVSQDDIFSVCQGLRCGKYSSFQTITRVFHNDHYLNQRVVEGAEVRFLNENRPIHMKKQEQPMAFKFGNLVGCTVSALRNRKNFFVRPSGYHEIPWYRAIDVDDYSQLELARAVARTSLIEE